MFETASIGNLHYLPNTTFSSLKLRENLRWVREKVGEGDDFEFRIARRCFRKASSGEADQRCDSRMSQGLMQDFASNEACGS